MDLASRASLPLSAGEPYRVMVVDDSAMVRGLITRSLEVDNEIRVVASVSNGQMAISALSRQQVDVIILDIEMPVLDGISAIPGLLQVDPEVKIIMASRLTEHGADHTFEALRLGATDYIAKPSSTRDMTAGVEFHRELVDKVKALAASARSHRQKFLERGRTAPLAGSVIHPLPAVKTPLIGDAVGQVPSTQRPPVAPLSPPVASAARGGLYSRRPVTLRPMPTPPTAPEVVAIGSSTGGPQALFEILSKLKGRVRQPVLITQHMPAAFTTILADHIQRQCGYPCGEAQDGEPVVGNRAYIAPGDFHMLIEMKSGKPHIKLSTSPPENYCRPAIDPMLRAVCECWGRKTLAVILTGMGQDGMLGTEVVAGVGGVVVAQDEASSVVWGMPGAVATAGHANLVLPLSDIAEFVLQTTARASS